MERNVGLGWTKTGTGTVTRPTGNGTEGEVSGIAVPEPSVPAYQIQSVDLLGAASLRESE